jgi:hypothetical protein
MRFKALITVLVLVALGAAAVASAGGITVWKTSFKTRAEVREVRALSGPEKKCQKSWKDKTALGVSTRGGPVDCDLSTPVQGDSAQPNHIVRVIAKMTKKTDKKVAKKFYLGVIVRADKKEGYEFRVFPKQRKYQLLKSGEILQQDKNNAVAGGTRKNRIQIEAKGQTITGSVNGKTVATFRDQNAEQVTGRQTGLTYGTRARSKKGDGVGFFDQLKVQVPKKSG